MNFDVASRTILLVRHGSHAYGLSTPTSDVDVKGVCIEPKPYYFGFLHHFEQQEAMANRGHPEDHTVYSLRKFMKLAADCNPNIIEMLHVDPSDVLKTDAFGERLRALGPDFLSKKAKHTFSGYAHAQLKRIKTHRAWLLDPPKARPERKGYGLSEAVKVSAGDLGAYDSLLERGCDVELPKDVVTLFVRERAYQAAERTWKQYENWKATRNAARAELEAKHGYDTKHGMHLLRLMKMCGEILRDGVVTVRRTVDRDDLMAVRNGLVSYDELIDRAEKLEAKCEALYETSTLPYTANHKALDQECVSMVEDYLKEHGS